MNGPPKHLGPLSPEKRKLLSRLLKAKGLEVGATNAAIPRRSGDGPVPVSLAQQRLWFLHQLDPSSAAYNIYDAVRIRGELDVAALGRSIQHVVERHESLRTTFAIRDATPVQVVAQKMAIELPIVDLKHVAPGEREAEARRLIARDAAAHFDLTAGPLLRALVLRIAPDDCVLFVNMHHIVSDGWSIGIFVREVFSHYDAISLGRSPALPELPIQYADFSEWQHRWLSGAVLDEQLAYWKARLDGVPPALDLPTDRPRSEMQTASGACVSLALSAPLASALRDLARKQGATLFMALFAAFSVLLERLSGQDDLAVGVPIANRNRAETANLIGFLVNTLVFRADLSDSPTFIELIGRVRQTALDAYAHQDAPFEKIVEAVQPPRDLGRTPLVQVMFNMVNLPPVELAHPSLRVEPFPCEVWASKLDMTLYVYERGEEVDFQLVYNADLFERDRMTDLLDALHHLLHQVVESPTRRIDALTLVTPRARAVLPDPTALLPPQWPGSIVERVVIVARSDPDRTAVVDARQRVTYGELAAASRSVARVLRAHGIDRGDVVAILAHRSAPLVWALLGTLRAGAAFAILDPKYPAERLLHQIRLAKPRALIRLEGSNAPPDVLDAAAAVVCRIDLPATAGEATAALGAAAEPSVEAPIGPDDVAYIAFTSGSTGVPKGIRAAHRPLSHFLAWHTHTFGLAPTDRFAVLSGLAHDPLLRDLFAPLWAGACAIVPDADIIESGRIGRWLAEHEITVIHTTPAMARLVAGSDPRPALPRLRYAFFGGDRLAADVVAELASLAPSARCVNFYGATETPQAMASYVVPATALPTGRFLPIGSGIDGVQLLVVNRAGELAGIGELGEIYVRTPYLAEGYVQRASSEEDRFLASPWASTPTDRVYRTGDFGRHRSDGAVEFVGRMDLQVKVRGFRVELGEIEAALAQHRSVRQAAVCAVDDGRGGVQLVAHVVSSDEPISVDALRAFLAAKVPDYMLPSAFVTHESLPMTPNKKIDRRALAARGVGGERAAFVAPRGPVEECLAAIWSEVLGAPRVGAHDDFFALGGHSLLGTQVVSRIRAALGVEVPLRALFEAPTLAELGARVASALDGGASPDRDVAIPRGDPDDVRLSFGQERLWFLDQLEPNSPFYNMVAAARLGGRLDRSLLERALSEVLARHDVLRTTIEDEGGRPRAVVHRELAFPLLLEDLTRADDREATLRERAQAEVRRPFALATEPPIRAKLYVLAEADHVLVVTMHHIAADGWSVGVLIREVATFYAAFASGRTSPLPELPIQYADYARWHRAWLETPALEAELAYWTDRLRGAPAALDLPTDYPRPPVRTLRGARHRFGLSPDLSRGVVELARKEAATPFMVLLAALDVLLARYTEQRDISVGTAIANRTRTETEALIGYFANVLVLRVDLDADPTFRDVVGVAKNAALGAYAHQDMPFERLVAALAPERDLSKTPLFQVALVLQNAPFSALELPGLTLRPFDLDTDTARFDLTFVLSETDGALTGYVEYATDLFSDETIERMVSHYRTLLAAAVARPGDRAFELMLEAETEQARIREWHTAAPPSAACLHALCEAQAARTPDATAVVFEDEAISYAELDRRANRLAWRVRRLGVGPGVLVGIFLERSPDLVVAALAVLKAGGAFVPLDPSYPEERIRFLLEDSAASVVVAHRHLLERLPRANAAVVHPDDPALDAEPSAPPAPRASQRDLAYVIHTSGSTGAPKGVMIEHRSIVNTVLAQIERFGVGPRERVLQFAASSFDASVSEIFTTLGSGGTLCLARRDDLLPGLDFARMLRTRAITMVTLPPSAVAALGDERIDGLSTLIVAGEACPLELARRWAPGRRFLDAYGPTEVAICASIGDVHEDDERVTIGRPIANARAHVLDRNGHPAPIGVFGELSVGGPGVARGYLGRPDLTARQFVPDPTGAGARMYRTGDRCRWLGRGALDFGGRIDAQVKVRGYRIEPGEIETALLGLDAVADAVVVARDAGAGASALVAYLVKAADPTPAATELRKRLKDKLPEYMVPSAFVWLERLPLTPNGKVDRRNLPAPIAHEEADGAYVPPCGPVEEALAAIWTEVLRTPRVGALDDFFARGGHSLLATQVASRVRKIFGVELPLRTLFEAPTLAALATRVDAAMRKDRRDIDLPPIPRAPRDGPLGLSSGQERLWFLAQLDPNSPFYNVSGAARLTGRLDTAALARSFALVVARHDAVRTTFEMGDGAPVQRILPTIDLPLAVTDLRDLPPAERDAAVRREGLLESEEPFDLRRGPLIRARLVRTGDDEHVLFLTMHHIVSDAWSISVLIQEVAAAYANDVSGRAAALPDLPLQYVDYAVWNRAWLSGDRLERQLSYWRAQLADAPPAMDLPLDRPRPPAPSFRGARLAIEIPTELGDAIRAISREAGVTPFMTLLTALAVVLSRYGGTTDVSIGTPIANRTHAETERLIGFFVNTLVMRTDLSGDPTLREAIARVKEVALGAYAHQDVPFERVVQEINPERHLGMTPLFQVMFVFQNAPGEPLALPGLEVAALDWDRGAAKFDLTLTLLDEPKLFGFFEFNVDVFERSTVQRIAASLLQVLESIAAKPATRISAIPISADEAKKQARWNETAMEYPAGRCVHELFELQARRSPDACAVRHDDASLTYAELDRRANRLAARLRSLGAKRDCRVGIFCDRSPEMIVAVLAVLKTGAAYVPLDPTTPRARLEFLIDDADLAMVVTGKGRVPHPQGREPVLHVDIAAALIGDEPDVSVASAALPDDVAYVIYTSGSTGRPKAAMVEHRGLTNLIHAQIRDLDLKPSDRVLQFVSLSFDVSVSEIFMALLSGATLVLASYESLLPGPGLVELLHNQGITAVSLPASVLAALPEAPLRALRSLLIGGESCPELTMTRWSRGRRLLNCYGPTEATVCATFAEYVDGKPSCIGTPIANVRTYIVGRHGGLLPIGASGELCVGGVGVGRGYLRRPALTAERFVPDPFTTAPGARMYRTGDRARLGGDGSITFLGRLDEQVKVRGFRIEPGEIESALSAHPMVREAVVVAREDTPGDRRLVAYLVCKTAEPITEELRASLKGRLPEYMIPSAFVTLDSLPRTSTGKVDRRALPAPDSRRTGLDAIVPPRDEMEKKLTAIWEDVLRVRPLGVTENFFDVGGNSFLVIRLLTEVHRAFGMQLPISTVFESGTVERMAKVLRERATTGSRALVRMRPGKGLAPLFFVHPVGGNVLCYGALARLIGGGRPMYGLQARGSEGEELPREDLVEMANAYVDEIRATVPEGPYALLGWSFGGTVAYEMARQLLERGGDVGLLVLLDSAAPMGTNHEISDFELRRVLMQDLVRLFSLPLSLAELAALPAEAIEDYAVAELEKARLFSPGTERAELRRLVRVYRSHMNAHLSYHPQPFEGRILFVQAGDWETDYKRDILGRWRDLARGGFDIVRTSGVHNDMLKRPHVDQLATKLKPFIERLAPPRVGG